MKNKFFDEFKNKIIEQLLIIGIDLKKIKREAALKKEIKLIKKSQDSFVSKIRKKEVLNVIFLVIFDSIWKYQGLYDLMRDDPKFKVKVVVIPHIKDSIVDMELFNKTLHHFRKSNYDTFSAFDQDQKKWLDVKSILNPDIVFFTVPYNYTYDHYTINNFLDKLTCYVPYAFMIGKDYQMFFNSRFHNLVWKFYAETSIHKVISEKKAINKGINVNVTGYPGCDKLMVKKSSNQVNNNNEIKTIIWAPHHLMKEGTKQSNFLDNFDLIFELAQKYFGKIEFVFKPHPLLKEKLYSYPEWGKEKTDKYFRMLKKAINIQIEEGEYTDLFFKSDAMIHDCGSFVSEYIFTEKPSLFMLKHKGILTGWNEYGNQAISVLYHSYSDKDIINFIENIVLQGKDTKKDQRKQFLNEVMLPSYNNTASENIYRNLKKSLTN